MPSRTSNSGPASLFLDGTIVLDATADDGTLAEWLLSSISGATVFSIRPTSDAAAALRATLGMRRTGKGVFSAKKMPTEHTEFASRLFHAVVSDLSAAALAETPVLREFRRVLRSQGLLVVPGSGGLLEGFTALTLDEPGLPSGSWTVYRAAE